VNHCSSRMSNGRNTNDERGAKPQDAAISNTVYLQPTGVDQFHNRGTALSIDNFGINGFVRAIRTGSRGQSFIDRKSELNETARNSMLPNLNEDPVHRLSVLFEGESFEINGVHYENQYSDDSVNNINFNGPLRPGETDELEEGGEWMTAMEKDGDWIWIPSKDVEKPEGGATADSQENNQPYSSSSTKGFSKKWTSLFPLFRRKKIKQKAKKYSI